MDVTIVGPTSQIPTAHYVVVAQVQPNRVQYGQKKRKFDDIVVIDLMVKSFFY